MDCCAGAHESALADGDRDGLLDGDAVRLGFTRRFAERISAAGRVDHGGVERVPPHPCLAAERGALPAACRQQLLLGEG